MGHDPCGSRVPCGVGRYGHAAINVRRLKKGEEERKKMDSGEMEYTKSYTPGEPPHGFLLERPGSPPLKVTLLPAALLAEAGGQRKHFGLYSYSALAEWASHYWISHWEQPAGKRYAWRWV